jgi:uncharacterized protein YjbI with pentapeptide repeats
MRDRFARHLTATNAAIFFAGVGFGVVLIGFFLTVETRTLKEFGHEIYSNFGIELISIALTVFVIDGLNRRAAKKERLEELILQMGSPDNGFAVEAIRLLGYLGTLRNGRLEWEYFSGANWQGAYLSDAQLQRVKLQRANLQGVDLRASNLEGADFLEANLQEIVLRDCNLERAQLWRANLERASLFGTNLQRANLQGANMKGSELWESNLEGANMEHANLEGVLNLNTVKFNEKTILPDGSFWTPKTDVNRFSDPQHPEFQQYPIYARKSG